MDCSHEWSGSAAQLADAELVETDSSHFLIAPKGRRILNVIPLPLRGRIGVKHDPRVALRSTRWLQTAAPLGPKHRRGADD